MAETAKAGPDPSNTHEAEKDEFDVMGNLRGIRGIYGLAPFSLRNFFPKQPFCDITVYPEPLAFDYTVCAYVLDAEKELNRGRGSKNLEWRIAAMKTFLEMTLLRLSDMGALLHD